MRKNLNRDLVLFFDGFYPKNLEKSQKRHIATVGIGGNIGNVRRRFKKLFRYLKTHPKVDILKTSPILKNPPFGFLDQDDFYNAVIVLKTNLSPKEFLNFLLHTEKHFKRERKFKNSPRTLDMDIIFFDKIKLNKKDLKIPHPKYKERDSVMIPLKYIGAKR
ncbi:MAG: 2-amino-4-hydroxy-6-hydroxymethyldihydropteridine diphosphokinase [Epsilonproteobacteria bacterium]|nr:2-amino-4-hydroxy-6-hydroxymethyldihydropteridine diphosphokinase [Campylobacterota bacterium]